MTKMKFFVKNLDAVFIIVENKLQFKLRAFQNGRDIGNLNKVPLKM